MSLSVVPRAAATTAALLLLAGTIACSGGGAPEATPVDESAETSDEEPTVAPLKRFTVEVYFPSMVGDGLVGEYREIFQTVTPGDRAKQIVADLISGPSTSEATRALPRGTRLRQVYVMPNGVAYLDFSADLAEGIGGGSMEELLTVYSIIDSVVLNVQEIKRVWILIDGQPVESLNGHIDLRRPLRPDPSLILAPVVV